MLSFSVTAISSISALAAGLLFGWLHCQWRNKRRFVPIARHGEEIKALRQRYRRRFHTLHVAFDRIRSTDEQMRARLRHAEHQRDAAASQLDAARVEVATLRQRIDELDARQRRQDEIIGALRSREQSVTADLTRAQEKIAGFESDQGLMRIERDELVAQTQRLRALPSAAEQAPPPPSDADASRLELADRNARIHELECLLRKTRGRARELQEELQTWKYRIAPIALHLEMQRDKSGGAPAPLANDDLCRIRGIGRSLRKKLHAAGIMRAGQLAGMSPDEISALAVRLGLAASRPLRDRWTEQAREICQDQPAAETPRSGVG